MTCCLTAALPAPFPFPLGVAVCQDPVETDRSIEAGLTTYLSNHAKVFCLTAGRVFPYKVPRHVEQAEYPCITYEVQGEPTEAVTAQSGAEVATIEVSCWAPTFEQSTRVAAAVRAAMQAFRGYWGETPIVGCWYQDYDDDVEEPKDDSGTFWYCRTLTFKVTYLVPIHTF